jgi:TM2 domain-containing membrane protein YozV
MNCINHPETTASAFCRDCGTPMCQECQRPALGTVYCADHLPVATAPPPASPPGSPRATPAFDPHPVSHYSPYTAPAAPVSQGQPPDMAAHPVLALILGFIPGVGAIYNGQYAKGLIHVVVFGLLVSLAASSNVGGFEPLIGLLIAAWVFYMAFEAFHTARSRRNGGSVEEFSSLFDVRPTHGRFPAGAILLIALGFILLLNTTDIIRMETLERYWPVGLIVCGLYMLYMRVTPRRHAVAPDTDASGNAEVH